MIGGSGKEWWVLKVLRSLFFFLLFWDSCHFKINTKYASDFVFNLILQIYFELVPRALNEMVYDPSQFYVKDKSLVNNTGSIIEAGVCGTYGLQSHLWRSSPFPCRAREQDRGIPRLLRGGTR